MLYTIIAFVLGAIIGVFVISAVFGRKAIGFLRLDHSDPEDNPYLFLELSKDLPNFSNKKYVILKVKVQDFIPQK